jgi:plasmid stability protein
VGLPSKAEITLRLSLPRAVLERLRARAIREGRKLEALIQEILEGAAK